MNDSNPSHIDKLHYKLLCKVYPSNKVKDPFLVKKLSDYYFSKLLPDFFYHTSLSTNYYPTIVATRVTLSITFLALFSAFMYYKSLSKHRDSPKKYSFNLFSSRFLQYEKELILYEKRSGKKVFLN